MSSKSQQIKDLCSQISKASGDELTRLIVELRKALQEHYEETRDLMKVSYPGTRQNPGEPRADKTEK